jgi:hypothetical protein
MSMFLPGKPSACGLILLCCTVLPARAQLIIPVPADQEFVEGNTNLYYPFSRPAFIPLRYQQVYAASQLLRGDPDAGEITNYYAPVAEGGWITDLWFRADGYSPGFFTSLSDVEVHLSTTPRSPNGLSPVFAENVGPDDMVVFSGSFTIGSGESSGAPKCYCDTHMPLSGNFFYHPNQGNLLLDVRVYQGAPPPPLFLLLMRRTTRTDSCPACILFILTPWTPCRARRIPEDW